MFNPLKLFRGRSGNGESAKHGLPRVEPSAIADMPPVKDPINISAAADLPPADLPTKAKKLGVSYPSHLTTAKPDRTVMPRNDRGIANTDLMSYRSAASTYELIRNYVMASPDISNALFSYLRLGIPTDYKAFGRNPDGTINQDATRLVQQILSRMDYIGPVDNMTGGYSLRSCSESLARELVIYGGMAGELILDKALVPTRIQPISITTIDYKPGKDVKTKQPFQKVGQDEFDLGFPTVCILHLDQDLLRPYAESMFQSAIKPVLFSEDLAQDLHRVIKKVIHPRTHVKIDEETFRKYGLSQAAQTDEKQAREELNALISGLEAQINNLEITDALVYLDSIGIEVQNPGETGLGKEYEVLQSIADSRMATGLKTMPAVLGRGGNANTASTETMLFVKSVQGTVTAKLNEFYSRLLTTAVRLMGVDAYIEFEYDAISLRPDDEMLAFKQTELSMVLDKLSLGFITDEEASIMLTGELPPPTHPILSGTMFRHGGEALVAESLYGGASNSGSALNQNLNPDTPTTGRGQNNRLRSV